jgi:hypothetical protein
VTCHIPTRAHPHVLQLIGHTSDTTNSSHVCADVVFVGGRERDRRFTARRDLSNARCARTCTTYRQPTNTRCVRIARDNSSCAKSACLTHDHTPSTSDQSPDSLRSRPSRWRCRCRRATSWLVTHSMLPIARVITTCAIHAHVAHLWHLVVLLASLSTLSRSMSSVQTHSPRSAAGDS